MGNQLKKALIPAIRQQFAPQPLLQQLEWLSHLLQEGIEQGWFRKPQTLAILAGDPDLDGILRTAIEIVDALCYLHHNNVLHGDLTGNNILLASSEADDRRFTVKVGNHSLQVHVLSQCFAMHQHNLLPCISAKHCAVFILGCHLL